MNEKILEVCVDSLESALAAKQGGADRLELCANLIIGGTTPSLALYRAVKKAVGLPVHVLLRPRFGDFLYTEAEFSILLEEAGLFLEAGAQGIVCGILKPDGSLDTERLQALVSLAHTHGAVFTLHRAFDLCKDPISALELCQELRVDFILTSGQENNCVSGIPLLKELMSRKGETQLLLGAGIDGAAIQKLKKELPQACQFHMSGKSQMESSMEYRKTNVNMGLPAFSEYLLWRTDPEKIREAKEALVGEFF